jgi:hypothetical protein
MNIVSSLGVGLLVGTSLGVVLPEGIDMLYTSVRPIPSVANRQLVRKASVDIPGPEGSTGQLSSPSINASFHLAVALALVSGYLVMHLMTFLPPLLLARNPQTPVPLSALPSSPRIERIPSGVSNEPPTGFSNTTMGLCMHALADGIALGSSAISNNLALEGIVFFAIMLHKVRSLRKRSDNSIIGTSFILTYCYPSSRIIPSSFCETTTSPFRVVVSSFRHHHIFHIIYNIIKSTQHSILERRVSPLFRRNSHIR